MKRGALLLLTSALISVAFLVWFTVREEPRREVAAVGPGNGGDASELLSKSDQLELPKPDTATPTPKPSGEPPDVDARTASAVPPPDYDAKYRLKTWEEMCAREEEMNDLVMSVIAPYTHELSVTGAFEIVTEDVAKKRERMGRYPDGRRRFTTTVSKTAPDGTRITGWIEFAYLDVPAVAELEREREAVVRRMDELRKEKKQKR